MALLSPTRAVSPANTGLCAGREAFLSDWPRLGEVKARRLNGSVPETYS